MTNDTQIDKSLSKTQGLYQKSKSENLTLKEKFKNLSRISRLNHERIIILKEKDTVLNMKILER